VAVLVVVLDHAGLALVRGAGAAGVTLFFVLSGYLITGLLLAERERTGRIDVRAFYARRARRLLPALIVFLAATVAYYGSEAVPSAVATLLYVANVPASGSGTALFFALHHMWSLAVEEQFYLVWPVALLALLRLSRTRSQAWPTLVAVLGVAALVRAGGYLLLGYDWAYRSTPSNVLPLLVGATVAAHVRWHGWRASRAAGLLGAAVLAAAVLAPVPLTEDWRIERTFLAVVAGALLLTRSDGWLRFGPLRYCGRISYGWYLWHVPFQFALGGVEGTVVSLGVAVLSFHLVESWFTRSSVSPGSRSTQPARAGA
jgi:peptidoglycan/LPS O-acetylase OafA/YrhL